MRTRGLRVGAVGGPRPLIFWGTLQLGKSIDVASNQRRIPRLSSRNNTGETTRDLELPFNWSTRWFFPIAHGDGSRRGYSEASKKRGVIPLRSPPRINNIPGGR